MAIFTDNLRNKDKWKQWMRALAPFAIMFIFNGFSEPLRHFLGVSWFVMPLILLMILAPWLVLSIRKTWREAAKEKQELERKYEAEDRLIFGQPREV